MPVPGIRRNDVLRDFSETFLDDHNICVGSSEQDIPKKGSFHLSTEDSISRTSSDLKRSVSDDYSLKDSPSRAGRAGRGGARKESRGNCPGHKRSLCLFVYRNGYKNYHP